MMWLLGAHYCIIWFCPNIFAFLESQRKGLKEIHQLFFFLLVPVLFANTVMKSKLQASIAAEVIIGYV